MSNKIRGRFSRVTSLLTLVFFLSNQVTFANPGAGIDIASVRETPGFLQIDIPAELATVDGLYEAPPRPDPKFILHIQNAHANYDAQQKIKQLLQYLERSYGIKTLFVEGASEDLNPDYLKMFPDKDRNLKLAKFLAEQGELTGAELYLLEADNKYGVRSTEYGEKTEADQENAVRRTPSAVRVKAHGIEDAKLYRENYDALKKVFGSEQTVKKYLDGFEGRLSNLASKVFPVDLLKLLGEWKKFEKGHREFMPYIRNLSVEAKRVLGIDLESLLAQVEWPQITRLLVLQSMEKELDTAKGLAERDKLIQFLKEMKVSGKLIAAIENFKDQRLSVMRGNLEGQAGSMEPRDLMEQLVTEAGPKGFKFSDYPHFSLHAGYLILKSELDPKGLFDEIKILFTRILDMLAATPEQKALLQLHREEELVRKLLNLELTRKDWLEVMENKDAIEPNTLVSRLKELEMASKGEKDLPLLQRGTKGDFRKSPQAPFLKRGDEKQKFRAAVVEVQDAAYKFYEVARKREDVFYEKIDSVMRKESLSKAVLITGGFHTDGITELLREHEVSYGILTPRLSEKSDENLYRNVMLQSKPSTFELSYLEQALGHTMSAAAENAQVGDSAFLNILRSELRGIEAVNGSLEKNIAGLNASRAFKARGIQIDEVGSRKFEIRSESRTSAEEAGLVSQLELPDPTVFPEELNSYVRRANDAFLDGKLADAEKLYRLVEATRMSGVPPEEKRKAVAVREAIIRETGMPQTTSASTWAGRLNSLHALLVQRLKQIRQQDQRADEDLVVVVIGIGGNGAPTVVDLAQTLVKEFSGFKVRVYGIDHNKYVVEQARKHLAATNEGLPIKYREGDFDLKKAGIPPADLIVEANVLIHYSAESAAFNQKLAIEGLKPQGIIVHAAGDEDTEEYQTKGIGFKIYARNGDLLEEGLFERPKPRSEMRSSSVEQEAGSKTSDLALPVSADLNSMAVSEFVKALRLEEVEVLSKKVEEVEAYRDGKKISRPLTVFKIQLPEKSDTEGAELSGHPLWYLFSERERANAVPGKFELIYNEKSQLIAIFPEPKDITASFRYVDLSDYYIPIEKLKTGMSEEFELAQKVLWRRGPRTGFLTDIAENKDLIDRFQWYRNYRRKEDSGTLSGKPVEGFEPGTYVYAELDLKTMTLRVDYFDPLRRHPDYGHFSSVSEKLKDLSEQDGKAKIIFPIFPSVYSTDSGAIAMDDFTLRTFREQMATFKFKDGDNVLDSATGPALNLWVEARIAQARGLRLNYYAYDLNPVAVANAKTLLDSIAGIPVHLKVAGDIGTFGEDIKFNFISANGPGVGLRKAPDDRSPPQDFVDLHDDGLAGQSYAENLGARLGRVLAANGVALVWEPVFAKNHLKLLDQNGLRVKLLKPRAFLGTGTYLCQLGVLARVRRFLEDNLQNHFARRSETRVTNYDDVGAIARSELRVHNEAEVRKLIQKAFFSGRLQKMEGGVSFADVYEDSEPKSPLAGFVIKIPNHGMTEERLRLAKENLGGLLADFNTVGNVTVDGVRVDFVVIQKKLKVFKNKASGRLADFGFSDLEKDLIETMVARGIYYNDALISENYGLDEQIQKLYLVDAGNAKIVRQPNAEVFYRPLSWSMFGKTGPGTRKFYRGDQDRAYFDRIGVRSDDELYKLWGTRIFENRPVPDIALPAVRSEIRAGEIGGINADVLRGSVDKQDLISQAADHQRQEAYARQKDKNNKVYWGVRDVFDRILNDLFSSWGLSPIVADLRVNRGSGIAHADKATVTMYSGDVDKIFSMFAHEGAHVAVDSLGVEVYRGVHEAIAYIVDLWYSTRQGVAHHVSNVREDAKIGAMLIRFARESKGMWKIEKLPVPPRTDLTDEEKKSAAYRVASAAWTDFTEAFFAFLVKNQAMSPTEGGREKIKLLLERAVLDAHYWDHLIGDYIVSRLLDLHGFTGAELFERIASLQQKEALLAKIEPLFMQVGEILKDPTGMDFSDPDAFVERIIRRDISRFEQALREPFLKLGFRSFTSKFRGVPDKKYFPPLLDRLQYAAFLDLSGRLGEVAVETGEDFWGMSFLKTVRRTAQAIAKETLDRHLVNFVKSFSSIGIFADKNMKWGLGAMWVGWWALIKFEHSRWVEKKKGEWIDQLHPGLYTRVKNGEVQLNAARSEMRNIPISTPGVEIGRGAEMRPPSGVRLPWMRWMKSLVLAAALLLPSGVIAGELSSTIAKPPSASSLSISSDVERARKSLERAMSETHKVKTSGDLKILGGELHRLWNALGEAEKITGKNDPTYKKASDLFHNIKDRYDGIRSAEPASNYLTPEVVRAITAQIEASGKTLIADMTKKILLEMQENGGALELQSEKDILERLLLGSGFGVRAETDTLTGNIRYERVALKVLNVLSTRAVGGDVKAQEALVVLAEQLAFVSAHEQIHKLLSEHPAEFDQIRGMLLKEGSADRALLVDVVKSLLLNPVYVEKFEQAGVKVLDWGDLDVAAESVLLNEIAAKEAAGEFLAGQFLFDGIANETSLAQYGTRRKAFLEMLPGNAGRYGLPIIFIKDMDVRNTIADVVRSEMREQDLAEAMGPRIKTRILVEIQDALNKAVDKNGVHMSEALNVRAKEFMADLVGNYMSRKNDVVKIADVGCGRGVMLNELAKEHGAWVKLFGVDPVNWYQRGGSDEEVAEVFARIRSILQEDADMAGKPLPEAKLGPYTEEEVGELAREQNFTHVPQEMETVQFPDDEKMDITLSSNALQYSKRPLKAIANLFNKLAPGGIAILHLLVPGKKPEIVEFYDALAESLSKNGIEMNVYKHLWQSGEYSLYFSLKRNGGEEMAIQYPSPVVDEIRMGGGETGNAFDIQAVSYSGVTVDVNGKQLKVELPTRSEIRSSGEKALRVLSRAVIGPIAVFILLMSFSAEAKQKPKSKPAVVRKSPAKAQMPPVRHTIAPSVKAPAKPSAAQPSPVAISIKSPINEKELREVLTPGLMKACNEAGRMLNVEPSLIAAILFEENDFVKRSGKKGWIKESLSSLLSRSGDHNGTIGMGQFRIEDLYNNKDFWVRLVDFSKTLSLNAEEKDLMDHIDEYLRNPRGEHWQGQIRDKNGEITAAFENNNPLNAFGTAYAVLLKLRAIVKYDNVKNDKGSYKDLSMIVDPKTAERAATLYIGTSSEKISDEGRRRVELIRDLNAYLGRSVPEFRDFINKKNSPGQAKPPRRSEIRTTADLLRGVMSEPVFPTLAERKRFAGDGREVRPGGKSLLAWLPLTDHIEVKFVLRTQLDPSKDIFEPSDIKGEGSDAVYHYRLPKDMTLGETLGFIQAIRALPVSLHKGLFLPEFSRHFMETAVLMVRLAMVQGASSGEIDSEQAAMISGFYGIGLSLAKETAQVTVPELQAIAEEPLREGMDREIFSFLGLKAEDIARFKKAFGRDGDARERTEAMQTLNLTEKAAHLAMRSAVVELKALAYFRGLMLYQEHFGRKQTTMLQGGIHFRGLMEFFRNMFRSLIRNTSGVGNLDVPALEETIRQAKQQHGENSEETAAAELDAIRAVLWPISRLPGWVESTGELRKVLEASPVWMKDTGELNCVGRSALTGLYLKQLGIKLWSVNVRLFQESPRAGGHVLILVRLSNGKYYWVEPSEDASEAIAEAHLGVDEIPVAGAVLDTPGDLHLKRVKIDPFHKGILSGFYVNLGSALHDQGNLAGGIAVNREAIFLDPDLATAHNNLGTALRDAEDLEGAISEYREAIRLDPDDVSAHYNLGSALNDKGNLNEASVHFQTFLDLARTHPELGPYMEEIQELMEVLDQARSATETSSGKRSEIRISTDPFLGNKFIAGIAFSFLVSMTDSAQAEEPKFLEWLKKDGVTNLIASYPQAEGPRLLEHLRVTNEDRVVIYSGKDGPLESVLIFQNKNGKASFLNLPPELIAELTKSSGAEVGSSGSREGALNKLNTMLLEDILKYFALSDYERGLHEIGFVTFTAFLERYPERVVELAAYDREEVLRQSTRYPGYPGYSGLNASYLYQADPDLGMEVAEKVIDSGDEKEIANFLGTIQALSDLMLKIPEDDRSSFLRRMEGAQGVRDALKGFYGEEWIAEHSKRSEVRAPSNAMNAYLSRKEKAGRIDAQPERMYFQTSSELPENQNRIRTIIGPKGEKIYEVGEGGHLFLKRPLPGEGVATDKVVTCVPLALKLVKKDGSEILAVGHFQSVRGGGSQGKPYERYLEEDVAAFLAQLGALASDVKSVKVVIYYSETDPSKDEPEGFPGVIEEIVVKKIKETIVEKNPDAEIAVKTVTDKWFTRGSVAVYADSEGFDLRFHYGGRKEDKLKEYRALTGSWSAVGSDTRILLAGVLDEKGVQDVAVRLNGELRSLQKPGEKMPVARTEGNTLVLRYPDGSGEVVISNLFGIKIVGRQLRIAHWDSVVKSERADLVPFKLPHDVPRPMTPAEYSDYVSEKKVARGTGRSEIRTEKPGELSIPQSAGNALDKYPGLQTAIKTFSARDAEFKQTLAGLAWRLVFSGHREFVKKLGAKAGLRGHVVFYPYGGADVSNPDALVEGVEDTVSQTFEYAGSIKEMEKFLGRGGGEAEAGIYKYRFDEAGAMKQIKEEHGLTGFGAVAIARTIALLGGTVTGIYFFDMEDDGRLRFSDPETLNDEENYPNMVVEFTVTDSQGSSVKKRYWSIQDDVFKANAGYEAFLENFEFQTFLSLGAPNMWDGFAPFEEFARRNSFKRTLDVARHLAERLAATGKSVRTFIDRRIAPNGWGGVMTNQPVWKLGYVWSMIVLGKGEKIGYSGEGDPVAFGDPRGFVDLETPVDEIPGHIQSPFNVENLMDQMFRYLTYPDEKHQKQLEEDLLEGLKQDPTVLREISEAVKRVEQLVARFKDIELSGEDRRALERYQEELKTLESLFDLARHLQMRIAFPEVVITDIRLTPKDEGGQEQAQLVRSLEAGEIVALDLRGLVKPGTDEIDASEMQRISEWFLPLMKKQGRVDKSYPIRELLKNAFVHGNKMNPALPIFIRHDPQTAAFDFFDMAQKTNIDQPVPKSWAGYGFGLLNTITDADYFTDVVVRTDEKSGLRLVSFTPKFLGLDPRKPPYVLGRPEIGADPIAELEDKILLNHGTGRIVFAGAKGPVIANQVSALWLVRHGETAINAMAGFQGQVDEDVNQLNEKGWAQVDEAATTLVADLKDKIDSGEEVVVIVSPVKRADDTAQRFIEKFKAAGGKVEVIEDPEMRAGLREMHYGVWDNKAIDALPAEEKAKLDRYRDGLDAMVSPTGGESYLDLLIRVKDWLPKLNAAYQGKTVVLFGHATQMSAMRVLMGDASMNDATGHINWRENRLQNAAPFNVVQAIQFSPRSETRSPGKDVPVSDVGQFSLDQIKWDVDDYISENMELLESRKPRLAELEKMQKEGKAVLPIILGNERRLVQRAQDAVSNGMALQKALQGAVTPQEAIRILRGFSRYKPTPLQKEVIGVVEESMPGFDGNFLVFVEPSSLLAEIFGFSKGRGMCVRLEEKGKGEAAESLILLRTDLNDPLELLFVIAHEEWHRRGPLIEGNEIEVLKRYLDEGMATYLGKKSVEEIATKNADIVARLLDVAPDSEAIRGMIRAQTSYESATKAVEEMVRAYGEPFMMDLYTSKDLEGLREKFESKLDSLVEISRTAGANKVSSAIGSEIAKILGISSAKAKPSGRSEMRAELEAMLPEDVRSAVTEIRLGYNLRDVEQAEHKGMSTDGIVAVVSGKIGRVWSGTKDGLSRTLQFFEELVSLAVGVPVASISSTFSKKFPGHILPAGERPGFVVDIMEGLPSEKKWQAIEAVLELNKNQHYGLLMTVAPDKEFLARFQAMEGSVRARVHFKSIGTEASAQVLRGAIQKMLGEAQKVQAFKGAATFVVTGAGRKLDGLGEGLPAALVERESVDAEILDTAGTSAAAAFSQELLNGEKLSENTSSAIQQKSGRRYRFVPEGLRVLLSKITAEIQGLQSLKSAA